MYDLARQRGRSRIAFLAFFVSLFLLFTPFEEGGPNPSMFPKYFAAGVSVLALAPLFTITRVRFRTETQLMLVVLAMVVFHTVVVNPVPFHFTLLIGLNSILAAFIYEASFAWRTEFVAAVRWLLLINAVAIILQAALFYLTGAPIIDFHKIVFGTESRFVEDFLNIARFDGLQVEPGTYANYMGCLAAIMILSSEFNAKFVMMCGLAVLSIFLTNSGSSAYFVPVLIMLLGYLWRSKVKISHLVLLIGVVAAYVVFSGVLEHLETRFLHNDDASLELRIEGVNAWKALTLDEKLIGVGFGEDPCVRCFYQDIGMVFNLLTRGGIIVTLAFALVVIRMLLANGPIVALLLLMVPIDEKMFFYEAPIWLFFLFAMTRHVKAFPARGRLDRKSVV